MSTLNNKRGKKRIKLILGKKTESGYEYSAKIDFKKDFSMQIANLIKEKKVFDELNLEIKRLKEEIANSSDPNKEKNLFYYYTIGKKLSILDNENFKEISPYSIFRRIKEEIPEILPHIEDIKTAQKHLEIMYKLGQIDEKFLKKASWDQWYEIMKFKEINKKQKLLKQILQECKFIGAGPSLRNRIKILLKK